MKTLTSVLPLFKHNQSRLAQGKLQYNVNIHLKHLNIYDFCIYILKELFIYFWNL